MYTVSKDVWLFVLTRVTSLSSVDDKNVRELNCDYNRAIVYPMQTFETLFNSVTRKHGRPILIKSDLSTN